MEAKKVAELAAQIVCSALQSGNMPSYSSDAVCTYYKAVYEQIAKCADEQNAAVMASLPKLP